MTSHLPPGEAAAGEQPLPDHARGLQRDLRERVTGQVGVSPSAPSSDNNSGTVIHLLERLARIWKLIPAAVHPGGATPSGARPGPASIELEAERLGLSVTFRSASASQIGSAAFMGGIAPCVVVGAGGQSHLVVGQSGRDLVVLGVAGDVAVSPATIAAGATGTIIVARPLPKPELASDEDIERGQPGATNVDPSLPGLTTRHAARALAAIMSKALGQQKPLLVQLVLASVLINLFSMILPLFSMVVFDRVIPHAAMETLWALALGIGLALLLEFALRQARLRLFDAAGQSISQRLQGRVMGRLLGTRLTDLPGGSGAMVQPMQDLDGMAQIGPHLVIGLFVDLPFFVLLIGLIAYIAGPVALAPLIGALVLIVIHQVCHKLSNSANIEHSSFQRRQQQLVIDSISAAERIRITGAGPHILARWDVSADAAGYSAHQTRYWHGLAAQSSAILVQAVMVVAIVVGVYRIDAALMTIGALSASILLVNRAMMPISIAIGLIYRAAQLLQTSAPIVSVMKAPLETGGDQRHLETDNITINLDAKGVSFAYPGEQRQTLTNINCSIQAGEKVGIIGKSGSGKSTLLRLLLRLQEPDAGRLRLDGRDIRQFDPNLIRRVIGYMPQDTHLMDGTLEHNLTLGLDDVSREDLERVCRMAGVHDFASAHPAGYSLQVGPGGQRLSGGERQAVGFARAMMGKPRTLVLDEPTAAFDNTTELRVINELKRQLGNTGLIVATHRLPVLALVDRIIWMDGGRIVADGPKAEIFAKVGIAA